MFTFLLILLILTSLVLVAAILLQSGTGQGLSASFGGTSSSPDSLIGSRQAGNLLTQVSWWGGAVFLVLSFILQIMSTSSQVPKSVLEQKLATPPAAPSGGGAAAPAVPLGPAPATKAPATPATPAPAKPSKK